MNPTGRDAPMVWKGKPAWSSYIYIWMFVTVIGIRGAVSFRLGLHESALFEAMVILFLVGLAFFLHHTTHFRITRQAVYRSKGFFGKQESPFPLSDVESVEKQQGPLERLFNCGNVVLKLKNGRTERLSGLKDPEVLCTKIRALL